MGEIEDIQEALAEANRLIDKSNETFDEAMDHIDDLVVRMSAALQKLQDANTD